MSVLALQLAVLICLVNQQLTACVDEQHRVFVFLLEDPAATILTINLSLDILAAYLLLGKKFVVLVEDLQIGVAVTVIDYGIHDVATDSIADHVYIISIFHISVNHGDISDMVVIPIRVAVEPEARPEEGARRYRGPDDGMHVDHVVMVGVMEVWGRMHGAVRRGHVTTWMTRTSIAMIVVRRRA